MALNSRHSYFQQTRKSSRQERSNNSLERGERGDPCRRPAVPSPAAPAAVQPSADRHSQAAAARSSPRTCRTSSTARFRNYNANAFASAMRKALRNTQAMWELVAPRLQEQGWRGMPAAVAGEPVVDCLRRVRLVGSRCRKLGTWESTESGFLTKTP